VGTVLALLLNPRGGVGGGVQEKKKKPEKPSQRKRGREKRVEVLPCLAFHKVATVDAHDGSRD